MRDAKHFYYFVTELNMGCTVCVVVIFHVLELNI